MWGVNMITTNREMIKQVYAEMERRLKMEWDDMQEIADCEDTALTLDDYNNLREWLVGALQGIYSVFYSQASNWSDTITFMMECERNSDLLSYFMEFKYEVLFNE